MAYICSIRYNQTVNHFLVVLVALLLISTATILEKKNLNQLNKPKFQLIVFYYMNPHQNCS